MGHVKNWLIARMEEGMTHEQAEKLLREGPGIEEATKPIKVVEVKVTLDKTIKVILRKKSKSRARVGM